MSTRIDGSGSCDYEGCGVVEASAALPFFLIVVDIAEDNTAVQKLFCRRDGHAQQILPGSPGIPQAQIDQENEAKERASEQSSSGQSADDQPAAQSATN